MLKLSFRRCAIAAVLSLPIAALTVKSALAEDLVFTLYNESSSPLVEFYVEATSEDNWGEDLLEEAVASGESGTVTIADGRTTCTYDIRGVFEDGTEVDERQLDLCELGSYTYKDK